MRAGADHGGRRAIGFATGPNLGVTGFLMAAAADRHVHIGLTDPMAVLLRGVTAVRDLAWPADRIFPLADASEIPELQRSVDPRRRARC